MLGYLILVIVQIAAAWFGAPIFLKYVPAAIGAAPLVFVHAAIFAVIVWVIGLIGSFVLKDVGLPGSSTLASALIGALIGAALVVFQVPAMIPLKFAPMFLPLGLAIAGYMIRR